MTNSLDQFKQKKIGLVLSGGVVKAASWHLGVCLALEELGFSFDTIQQKNLEDSLRISTLVGSSAGAMICLYLAGGHKPKDVIHSILGDGQTHLKRIGYKDIFHLKRPRFQLPPSQSFNPFSDLPFPIRKILSPINHLSGFFSADGLRNYIKKNILPQDDFEKVPVDLFIVATQLDHSRKVIFSKYNYPNPRHDSTAAYYTNVSISHAAAASMSVPPVFIPYPIKNQKTGQIEYYIDGEIRETLSTHIAEDNNCDLIISSWTHTPYHYMDEIGSLVNFGLPAILLQSIYLLIQKKIVEGRAQRQAYKQILETVDTFLKEEKFDAGKRKKLLETLERKFQYKSKAMLVDIFPDHDDYKVFFGNSFSLNPKTNGHTMESAYKKTLKVFSGLK